MKLTPKQERFVTEYLIDLNATQAAIRAGYSKHTADVQGPRLLGNVGVQAAIEAGQKRISARLEVTADAIVRRAWEIANEDKGDRVGALALLAKRHREFSEKQEHTGTDGGPIQIIRNTPELK